MRTNTPAAQGTSARNRKAAKITRCTVPCIRLVRPDASVMQQTKLVVTVDVIDRATNMVTYHGFDNRRVLRAVQYPQLLEGVRVGDVVTITYTRAQAVGITKAQ